MLNISTGLRNYIMGTGSLRAAMSTTVLKIFAGTIPADANAALGGATLLVVITTGGDGSTALAWEAAVADGVLVKETSDTWGGEVTTSGTAAFFRFETLADGGEASSSALRMQGRVAINGGELNLSSLGLVDGATQTIDNYSATLPAQ